MAAAQEIGRTGVHPPYALFVLTGAARTDQMVTILRAAAGQEDLPVRAVTGLRSAIQDRWRQASNVGHCPTNEAAVLGLTGQLVQPLGKGEGVLVTEDEGRFAVAALN